MITVPLSRDRTAKPGHRKDKSEQSYFKGFCKSGEAVCSLLFMIDIICKHCAENGVAQMVVARITREERIQMLYRVVDVLLCGNTLVVAVQQRFIVFLRTIFRCLSNREHRMRRQEVERIRCIGLFAAVLVLYDGCIRLYALNNLVHSILASISSIILSTSRMNSVSVFPQRGSILRTSAWYFSLISCGK